MEEKEKRTIVEAIDEKIAERDALKAHFNKQQEKWALGIDDNPTHGRQNQIVRGEIKQVVLDPYDIKTYATRKENNSCFAGIPRRKDTRYDV